MLKWLNLLYVELMYKMSQCYQLYDTSFYLYYLLIFFLLYFFFTRKIFYVYPKELYVYI